MWDATHVVKREADEIATPRASDDGHCAHGSGSGYLALGATEYVIARSSLNEALAVRGKAGSGSGVRCGADDRKIGGLGSRVRSFRGAEEPFVTVVPGATEFALLKEFISSCGCLTGVGDVMRTDGVVKQEVRMEGGEGSVDRSVCRGGREVCRSRISPPRTDVRVAMHGSGEKTKAGHKSRKDCAGVAETIEGAYRALEQSSVAGQKTERPEDTASRDKEHHACGAGDIGGQHSGDVGKLSWPVVHDAKDNGEYGVEHDSGAGYGFVRGQLAAGAVLRHMRRVVRGNRGGAVEVAAVEHRRGGASDDWSAVSGDGDSDGDEAGDGEDEADQHHAWVDSEGVRNS